jgi:hypothetical protein
MFLASILHLFFVFSWPKIMQHNIWVSTFKSFLSLLKMDSILLKLIKGPPSHCLCVHPG